MEGVWGLSWTKFEETAQKTDAMLGWPLSRNPLSPTTGRLCREDMAIYGEDPALDSLSLVVCRQCGRVVKSQALVKHNEQYHSKQLEIPLARAALPPYVPPVRSTHSIGLSSSAASTSPSIEGVRGDAFTASNLPSTLLGAANNKTKEYDANRHCGVWMEDERRPCTHSLSCKVHSLEERQGVRGRSKPFDVLLNERKNKKLQKNKLKRTESQLSTGQPAATTSPDGPMSSGAWSTPAAESQVIEENVPTDMETFPNPLAVSMLRSRSSLKGGLLFGRRSDNLRGGLVTLSGKGREYHHTTVHRKHSYNSLLRERAPKKYYHHRHRKPSDKPSLPPMKLPVPGHPQPPAHTPSQPLSSPLTANTVLANISSIVSLPESLSSPESPSPPVDRARAATPPHTLDLNQPINNGVLYETGGSGFLNHGAQDLTPGTEVPVAGNVSVEPQQTESVSGSKSKKNKRGKKRRKHKHSRPNPGGEEAQNDSRDGLHVNGVANAEGSDTMGTVRVKQEPLSDHEEERPPVTKSPAVGLNGMVAHNAASPAHHTFNSVNSAQSFVINPSHQLPNNYPLVTNLSPHVRGLVQMPGMSQNPSLFQSQQRFQLPTSSAPSASPLGLQILPETLQRQQLLLQQQLLLANNPGLLQQHSLQQQTNSFSPSSHPGFINLTAMNRTGSQQKSPGMPQLHHAPTSSAASPHVAQPIFQLTNRQAGGGRVRAPLSHIPSAQRNLPQLSSLGQAHNISPFNQSLYHPTPASTAQRFPPQVT